MKIGEAAAKSGLPVKTVRYYADIALVAPEGRAGNGYRDYGAAEIGKLVFVRRARAFGFSVDDCRELLSLYEDHSRSSRDVKQIALARISDIEARMAELKALHDELHRLADNCHGDDRPDCPILDGLSQSGARLAG